MRTLYKKTAVIALLACRAPLLFGFSLLAAIALLVHLDRLKYRLVEFHQLGGGLSATLQHALTLLGPLDIFLVASVTLLCLAWVYLELRNAELSTTLMRAQPAQMLWLLLALLIWFAHAYLYPGYLLGGDVGSHIARTSHFRMGLEQGQALYWNNYFYLGSPFLQFTGPLYFWLTGIADLLLRDPNLTTKLFLLVLRIAGGVFFYFYMLRLGVARFAALVAAIGYSGAFAYTHLILWKGALPQAITLALLPLAFLLLEKMLHATKHFSAAWAGLTLVNAALFINHQATGMMAGLFIAAYVLVNLLLRRASWQRAWPLALSGGISLAISAFVVAPILSEKHWVMMYSEPRLIEFVWPTLAYFKQLLVWHNSYHGVGMGSGGYIGLTIAVLAAWGIYRLGVDKRMALRGLGWALVACVALSFTVRGAHVRDIIFTLFFVSALAGVGVYCLMQKLSAQRHFPALLLGLLLLDSGSTAIQPLARTDKTYFDQAARYLLDTSPMQRILLTDTRGGKISASIGPGGPPLHYYPIQQVIGAHSLTATLAHNYIAASIKSAEHDLREAGQLTPTTAVALAMLNVGRIVNDRGSAFGFDALGQVRGAVEEGPMGRVLILDAATPLVFAPTLLEATPAPDLDKPVVWNEDFGGKRMTAQAEQLLAALHWMVAQTGYDSQTRSAQRIVVRSGERKKSAFAPLASVSGWAGKIKLYRVGLSDISLEVESASDGYLQLSHPWYPYALIDWNGQRIAPLQGYTNLMVVPVRAGLNHYTISFARSSMRVMSGWFSFALSLGVLVWLGVSWLRERNSAVRG